MLRRTFLKMCSAGGALLLNRTSTAVEDGPASSTFADLHQAWIDSNGSQIKQRVRKINDLFPGRLDASHVQTKEGVINQFWIGYDLRPEVILVISDAKIEFIGRHVNRYVRFDLPSTQLYADDLRIIRDKMKKRDRPRYCRVNCHFPEFTTSKVHSSFRQNCDGIPDVAIVGITQNLEKRDKKYASVMFTNPSQMDSAIRWQSGARKWKRSSVSVSPRTI